MFFRPAKFVLGMLILITLWLAAGCSILRVGSENDLPPLLSQDELVRPYVRLGRIQVTRENYGTDVSIMPDIKSWGFFAVRQEAAKMGADAVILVEVTGRTTTVGVIPSTEYRATGVAIRFK